MLSLVFAVLVGLLATVTTVLVSSPTPTSAGPEPTAPASSGAGEAAAEIRLTSGEPISPRSADEAPEPTTTTPVLPGRCLDDGDTLPSRPGACALTSYGKKRPTVVVWGDSHAWQQLPALRAQAERTRTNLVAFVMGACPPMDLRSLGYRGLCVRQTEKALTFIGKRVQRERPVKVVLGGFWELYRDYDARGAAGWEPTDAHDRFLLARAEMFAAGGGRLFRVLGRRQVATAAIAQAPWVSESAPACAAGEQPYACDLPRTTAIPDEAETAQWVQDQLGRIRVSGYIDTSRFVCDASVCHPSLDGQPVYLDELHLDPAVTASFAPEYRDLFR
ncbi:MAG: SGNH hydrolase domain-containing protein [Nocardioides sp.]